jgi:CDP-diacylglycerol--serine O-phosphatidyltransferase
MKVRRRKRNVKIIFPSTITTFSMVFGFIAIITSSYGEFNRACYLVMIAIIMDGLDGKIARITNTATEFGIQYDSLSDLVAFGVAPAVIYFNFYLHQQVTDQVYYLLPVMFMVCGAIRLARFNVTATVYSKAYFTGLPIPAAAFMVAVQPLFFDWATNDPMLQDWGLAPLFSKLNFFHTSVVLMVILSLTMISTLKFDTPVHFWFHKYRPKSLNYVVIFGFLALILVDFAVFAAGIGCYYLLVMFGREFYHKIRRHGLDDDGDVDPLADEAIDGS